MLNGVDKMLKKGIQSKKSITKEDPLFYVIKGGGKRLYTSRRSVVF